MEERVQEEDIGGALNSSDSDRIESANTNVPLIESKEIHRKQSAKTIVKASTHLHHLGPAF